MKVCQNQQIAYLVILVSIVLHQVRQLSLECVMKDTTAQLLLHRPLLPVIMLVTCRLSIKIRLVAKLLMEEYVQRVHSVLN
jgi:hypothetical protein